MDGRDQIGTVGEIIPEWWARSSGISTNFFLLEPNIAGIGINFNAIINYFARKKTRKKPETK